MGREGEIRNFVITLYLNDKSIMIYEQEAKNSGYRGGKFLEKNAYKNVLEERLFEPVDFLIGKIIQINNYQFEILSCDAKTREWYSHNLGVEMCSDFD